MLQDIAFPKPFWPQNIFSPQNLFQGQLSQSTLHGMVTEPVLMLLQEEKGPRADKDCPKFHSSLMKLSISFLTAWHSDRRSPARVSPAPESRRGEPSSRVQDEPDKPPAQKSLCPFSEREACASAGKPAPSPDSFMAEGLMLSKVLATCGWWFARLRQITQSQQEKALVTL